MTKPTFRDALFEDLQEQYGAQFQTMPWQSKLAFRAALANYQCLREIWSNSGDPIPEDLIDNCIESAYAALWDEDAEVCQFIQHCSKLTHSDIEGLIESLTAQLKRI